MVASNSDEIIATASKDAFALYNKNPSDVAGTLKALSEPLRGVGPATASLLLSVYDPTNVIFFSDEAYRWLVADGEKVKLLYNVKEYQELNGKAHALMSRLKVTPIDVEKTAFVLIKENEPIRESAPEKVPSGRPRGRPALPDSEKKAKKPTVPGRGRGRPPGSGGVKKDAVAAEATGKREKPSKLDSNDLAVVATKETGKRGRPAKTDGSASAAETKVARPRGRPPGVKSEKEADVKTPAKSGGKRKSIDAEPTSTPRSSKRAKS